MQVLVAEFESLLIVVSLAAFVASLLQRETARRSDTFGNQKSTTVHHDVEAALPAELRPTVAGGHDYSMAYVLSSDCRFHALLVLTALHMK